MELAIEPKLQVEKIDLSETGKFSPLFIDYLNQKKDLAPYYNSFPTIDTFKSIIAERKFSTEKRIILHKVLDEQYASLEKSPQVISNLLSLDHEKTFTVTTGHQLNIFTGPLYFIYKIITTINLAKELKAAYPDCHFVPVYWMASEDHDFEEISYFNLFGKKYTWDTDQKGAVGKFRPQSLSQVLGELPEEVELFEKAYLDSGTLANAVRYYVNELFGDQGLIVVDADSRELKSMFSEVINDDLFNHTANSLAEKASAELGALGYSSQIFPRHCNFFHLNTNHRERIVREDGVFKVLNTDIQFTEEELKAKIQESPELFSPNVVLRPLYQETILPNLAYIGGPSELAYWLQLKEIFDHYSTDFPLLVPRNFALYLDKGSLRKLSKLNISASDIFRPEAELKEMELRAATTNEIDLDEELAQLKEVFSSIENKSLAIDKSLKGFIGAMESKVFKDMDNIQKRLKKAEEKNHDTAMTQIDSLKAKLFPNGSLQERHDNFLNFYLNNPDFIKDIQANFDPLDFRFLLLSEQVE
ncbi:MAG: bacillithiol biosynthesis cysteine-adding enzyme BshC [Bacteroidota bacterium]